MEVEELPPPGMLKVRGHWWPESNLPSMVKIAGTLPEQTLACTARASARNDAGTVTESHPLQRRRAMQPIPLLTVQCAEHGRLTGMQATPSLASCQWPDCRDSEPEAANERPAC